MKKEVRELLRRVQSTADFGYVAFDSINDTNALGDNALHCACVWGDVEAAKLLVEHGININQRGEHGFTPLKVAVDFGFREIADYLIANGADTGILNLEPAFDRERHTLHLQRIRDRIRRLEEQIKVGCDSETPSGTE